ncbi:MAG: hypothetical protein DMG70_33360 [Acidobacteria bacterium]|nr:MAG: hypothetical protein DMG70_33360 [Acidobacteriota bacterium]
MIFRFRLLLLPLLVFALIGAACSKSPTQGDSASAKSGARLTIVFMTDFGTANDAVAICKAVMLSIAPDARILDITHQVTPYSIEEGARFLEAASPYYPAGTVFVVVIDPGVGTSRKAIIAKSRKGQYFVLPDNGLITPVMDRDGLDSARDNPRFLPLFRVATFFLRQARTLPRDGISSSSAPTFPNSSALLRKLPPPRTKASPAISSRSTIPSAPWSPIFLATNSRSSATTSAINSGSKSTRNR